MFKEKLNLSFPMKQHVGAPCKPVVNNGQSVKRGQIIGVPQGLGAYIHSSVSGEVVAADGNQVIIKADKHQSEDYIKLTSTDKLELIKEAGIVGSGGAGFPAYVKFSQKIKGGYVIANAAECEPMLEHNMKLLRENPELVIKGLKHVMEITEAEYGYIAIKPKHKEEMIAIAKVCKNEKNIEIKYLPDMYPAGDERVIVREILGVELELGALPSTANAIISNVETLKNITLAIESKKPVIDKDFTVTGRINNKQVFMNTPIGMPIEYFIEKSGGTVNPHGEILVGGPFTGRAAHEGETITKTTGAIIVSMPFIHDERKVGLLECECGAQEPRLRVIAEGMGAQVVAVTKCKRMEEINGRFRCTKPGCCPGQAEKVLELKKAGAEIILTGTCED